MFNQKQFEKQVYTLRSTGIVIIEILILSCLITVASAATWTVDDSGGADFTMIQEAIDAAESKDTIKVRSGIYRGDIDVCKQLYLIGEDTGEGKPLVNSYESHFGSAGETPITITADGCTVQGFNLSGTSNNLIDGGIRIESSNNSIIDNKISYTYHGGLLLLESSNNNTITMNDINYNDENGIELQENCNDNQFIDNNVCFNRYDAIKFEEGCNNCILSGNNISFNEETAIKLNDDCLNNQIIDNEICFNDEHGIEVNWYSSNTTLINNTVSFNNEMGIRVYSDNNTLTGNTVSNNHEGIILNDVENCTLGDNTINNNSYNFNVKHGNVHDIDISNTINGKPIYYLVAQSDIVIDPSWNAGYIGVVDSHNVIIKDMTLTNNGQGILFDHVKDSIIENVNVINNTRGIYLGSSTNITLKNNNADLNKEYGLFIDWKFDNKIDTSNTVNGKPVYYFYDIHDQTISGLNTNHLTIAKCSNLIIKDININVGDGIFLFRVEDSVISNNTVTACFDGIRTNRLNNNSILKNSANKNEHIGIFIDDSCNNIIDYNIANENGKYGIKIDGDSSNNTINNNYADATREKSGIRISGVNNNTVSGNHVAFNGGGGIHLTQESANNRIVDNNASFNCEGISVWYSSNNNIIQNNTISNNERCGIFPYKAYSNEYTENIIFNNAGDGIYAAESDNNTVANNTIHDNIGTGLVFTGSSDYNLIYHNNFIDNNKHSSDHGSNNTWDNGPVRGGNYWSGHICNGNPSNGDQLYNIDECGIDHYPFENMNGWY